MYVRKDSFQIGAWRVQPALNRVQGPDGSIQLEPRVMRVLVCLTERAGDVVTRNELLDAVWGDTVVNDDSLTRTISDLRKILDDDPRHPQVIETIRSVGYRLIAPVRYEPPGDALPGTPDRTRLQVAPQPPTSTQQPSRLHRLYFIWPAVFILAVIGGFIWVHLSTPTPVAPIQKIPFTTLQGTETEPAFSPDGNRIAFVWKSTEDENEDIYVKLVGSETMLRLTWSPTSEQSPTWSPDGRHIAFLRTMEDTCAIILVSALGGDERRLADCTPMPEATLAWSPDGNQLALPIQSDPNGPLAIYLLSVENRTLHPATFPSNAADLYPSFSPDGKRLSFIRFTTERVGDLHVASLEGGEPERLTFDNRLILGHAWSPNGNRIVFSSNRAGNRRLWYIPIAGGTPEWLASLNTYDPVSPVFAGPHFAYVEWFVDYNIWRLPLKPNGDHAPVRVVASTRWDRHPTVSSDGRRIVFTSNRSGSNQLWTSKPDGSDPIRLTSFDNAYVSAPRWSPDGRQIVFEARLTDQADLYLVEPGGVPRQLTSGPGDDLAPSWSADGRWIYFSSNRTGSRQIWKQSITGDEVVQVTTDGGVWAFESPDGRFLYYTGSPKPGIWKKPVYGVRETQVLTPPESHDWDNWSVTGQGLYFVQRASSGQATLALFDFETGELSEVAPLPNNFLNRAFELAVTPDGSALFYTQNDRQESDIMYIESFH